MIGWMILVVYVFGALFSFRMFTLRLQAADLARYLDMYGWRGNGTEKAISAAKENLGINMMLALLFAPIWPLGLPVLVVIDFARRGGLFTTKMEKNLTARMELEKLRARAKEYGLPME
jgi:hypothetical protein